MAFETDVDELIQFQHLTLEPITHHISDSISSLLKILHQHCFKGHFEIVKKILHDYPELKDEPGQGKFRCLHFAVQGRHLDLVSWLINEARVDICAQSNRGDTGLLMAAHMGSDDIIQFFFKLYLHPDLDKCMHLRTSMGVSLIALLIVHGSRKLISDYFKVKTPRAEDIEELHKYCKQLGIKSSVFESDYE